MVEKYKIDETNYCSSCPECNHSWDNGEVVDYLLNKDLYLGGVEKRAIAENMARNTYGWTPENKKRMSGLAFIEVSDGHELYDGQSGYYQCPNCGIAWHSVSGERTDLYKKTLDAHLNMIAEAKEIMDRNKKL